MTNVQWSQPSLDLGPRPAVRLVLEVLLDPQDETAVVSVEARTFPERTLVALYTSPPAPYFIAEEVVRLFGTDFTKLLREHTGPF